MGYSKRRNEIKHASFQELCEQNARCADIASKINDENEAEAFVYIGTFYPDILEDLYKKDYNPFVHAEQIADQIGVEKFFSLIPYRVLKHDVQTGKKEYNNIVKNHSDQALAFFMQKSPAASRTIATLMTNYEDLKEVYGKDILAVANLNGCNLTSIDPEDVIAVFGRQTGDVLKAYRLSDLGQEWKNAIIAHPEVAEGLTAFSTSDMLEFIDSLPTDWIVANKGFLQNLRDNYPNILPRLPKEISSNQSLHDTFRTTHKLDSVSAFDEFDVNWYDKSGKVVDFFTMGNIPITSKEDYMRIYHEFISSNLTAKAFCERYKISSEAGLNNLVKKVKETEPKRSQQLAEAKTPADKQLYQKCVEVANQIADGSLSVDEFINGNDSSDMSLQMLLELAPKDKANDVAKKLVRHYSKKGYYLTNKEFLFLRAKGFSTIRQNAVSYFTKPYLISPDDNQLYLDCAYADSTLKPHLHPFNRSTLCSRITKGGHSFEITKDMVDQAICFCEDNNLHLCNGLIQEVCQEIGLGKLDYTAQTEQKKEELKALVLELLENKQSLEDYLQTVKASNSYEK